MLRRRLPSSASLRELARRLSGERGFAITEMAITTAILGTVVTGLVSVFVSTTKAEVDQNMRFRAQQEARLALDQLRSEARAARCVTLFGADPSAAIPAPGPAPQIQLTYGADCASPSARRVTWCVGGSAGSFALFRRDGVPAAACSGKRVAELLTHSGVFTLSPGSPTRRVTLGVTFRVSVDGKSRLFHLRDDIVLRNSSRS